MGNFVLIKLYIFVCVCVFIYNYFNENPAFKIVQKTFKKFFVSFRIA